MAGRKKGTPKTGGRKKGTKDRTPADLMHEMVEHIPASEVLPPARAKIDPIEFCQAVINGDTETLKNCGVEPDKVALRHKMEAARIAAPYTNKRKPIETVNKHEISYADEIQRAEQRTLLMRKGLSDDDGKISIN